MRTFDAVSILFMSLTLSLTACSDKQNADPQATGGPIHLDQSRNELFITADNQITWNGQEISEAQLAKILREAKALSPEPELFFQPDVHASYDVSAKVIRIIKESGVTQFGFVGNEMHVMPPSQAR